MSRTIGKRRSPTLGRLRAPSAEQRRWVAEMAAQVQSRVPKGIFRYRSHEEANADWERWHVEELVETAQRRKR